MAYFDGERWRMVNYTMKPWKCAFEAMQITPPWLLQEMVLERPLQVNDLDKFLEYDVNTVKILDISAEGILMPRDWKDNTRNAWGFFDIQLSKNSTNEERAITLVHEFGHAFYRANLSSHNWDYPELERIIELEAQRLYSQNIERISQLYQRLSQR